MNKLLVEHVANALMEHIPSRNPLDWDKDDPGSYKWAKSLALIYAEAAIEAVNSYKHPFTVGTEIYKNKWLIPLGTKLGRRPTKKVPPPPYPK